jgi:hypothetical protein
VLANGFLLLIKDTHSAIHVSAAVTAAALALVTYLIGLRRQRILARRPLPDRLTARTEVYLTAASVVALILLSGVALTV